MPGLRLLFLVGTSDIGGTERFLTGLAGRLDSSRFSRAICVVRSPGSLAGDYDRVAERTWHLEWDTRSLGQVLGAWENVLLAWRPDVVMLFGLRANLLGRFVSGGAPVIHALRSPGVGGHGRRTVFRLDRATFDRVSLCIANSQSARAAHLEAGFPSDRFVHIPNGVDPAPFKRSRPDLRRAFGLADDEAVVLSVGHLEPVKNHAMLLEASRAVHDRGLTHRLWIAGQGPERPALERLTAALSLSAHVQFLGVSPDLADRFVAADLFALSSKSEGMPNVLLEACAAGLPIVTTAVGAAPEICRSAGLVVPEGDAPAMADALVRVLQDRPLRASLRAGAHRTAERFAWPNVVEQYSRVFECVARRCALVEVPALWEFHPE